MEIKYTYMAVVGSRFWFPTTLTGDYYACEFGLLTKDEIRLEISKLASSEYPEDALFALAHAYEHKARQLSSPCVGTEEEYHVSGTIQKRGKTYCEQGAFDGRLALVFDATLCRVVLVALYQDSVSGGLYESPDGALRSSDERSVTRAHRVTDRHASEFPALALEAQEAHYKNLFLREEIEEEIKKIKKEIYKKI